MTDHYHPYFTSFILTLPLSPWFYHYHPDSPLPPLYLPRADSPRSICCASEPVSPSHNSMYTAVKRGGQSIDWFIKIMVYLRILYFTQEVSMEWPISFLSYIISENLFKLWILNLDDWKHYLKEAKKSNLFCSRVKYRNLLPVLHSD